MTPLLPSLAAAALYFGTASYQALLLSRREAANRRLLGSLGWLALLLHALGLYPLLLENGGLSLDFFTASSLLTAAVIGLTLFGCLRIPVQNLLVMLFPLGTLTILLALFAPGGTTQPIREAPGILAHILLSLLAYGLMTIAVLQSLLLLLQNRQLKTRKPAGIIRTFPPLQTMESLLFGFLWAGWLSLSLSLVSGWLFLQDLFAQHLAHKTLLACVAWVVFGVLLWGRHQLGWRGGKAIRWTQAGFLLLMLAYFGSKWVREFILHI